MRELIEAIAIVLGVALVLLSAVGILRMPDVYIRLQVASKAASLGVALLMLGVALHFDEATITIRALLVVVFLYLTAPVAAHLIGRAAYLSGASLTGGTTPNDLDGAYDSDSGRLRGADDGEGDAATVRSATLPPLTGDEQRQEREVPGR